MQKHRADGPGPPPPLLALDLLAELTRRRIIWELAHEPRTVTELARRLGQSQPRISKHLRTLREAGLVESKPDASDGRARLYDIRREPLIELHLWLQDVQGKWWSRTRHIPTDPDYYKGGRLNPNFTTRGTPRKRTLRALKDPWEK
jgi:DNA-binding transcriptional ArsR family regulator